MITFQNRAARLRLIDLLCHFAGQPTQTHHGLGTSLWRGKRVVFATDGHTLRLLPPPQGVELDENDEIQTFEGEPKRPAPKALDSAVPSDERSRFRFAVNHADLVHVLQEWCFAANIEHRQAVADHRDRVRALRAEHKERAAAAAADHKLALEEWERRRRADAAAFAEAVRHRREMGTGPRPTRPARQLKPQKRKVVPLRREPDAPRELPLGARFTVDEGMFGAPFGVIVVEDRARIAIVGAALTDVKGFETPVFNAHLLLRALQSFRSPEIQICVAGRWDAIRVEPLGGGDTAEAEGVAFVMPLHS